MADPMFKVDMHVHSRFSTRPSQWILQKIGCPESFTEPRRLYDIALSRGMDMVTITDHNTIAGALEIAHLPNTFISEEITTYFPEDRCKLHVLAYDITETQHEDIQLLRDNVFDLVPYLREQNIVHVLAHPLFAVNDRLTPAHFEQALLLFNILEENGTRDARQNKTLRDIVSRLTPLDIDRLANTPPASKPYGDEPWEKGITGGSDDHSSLNIARMHTVFPGQPTLNKRPDRTDRAHRTARRSTGQPRTMPTTSTASPTSSISRAPAPSRPRSPNTSASVSSRPRCARQRAPSRPCPPCSSASSGAARPPCTASTAPPTRSRGCSQGGRRHHRP